MPQSTFSFQPVSPTAIIADMRWSLHPWEEEVPAELKDSFRNSGILTPPCLLPQGESGFILLTGYKRLRFWIQENPKKSIVCKCFHATPAARQCLAIALDDQKFGNKELTLAEQARFIQLASTVLPETEKEKLAELLPLLGLKRNPQLLKNLLTLAQEPQELLQATHNGEISLQIYTELQKLKQQDRTALLSLFSRLRLGGGKQRRFLLQLRDCAYTHSQSIADLLQQQDLLNITEHRKLTISQKIQHLSSLLQAMLQPSLHREEKSFQEQVRELELPENYALEHSPSFEKDEITLKITFADFAHCRQYLNDHLSQGAKNNSLP